MKKAKQTPEAPIARAPKTSAAWWAKQTPEERSARVSKYSKKAWAKVTPEERSARMQKRMKTYWAKLTPNQRSARIKKQWAQIPPERRTERLKKSWAKQTPEQRSAHIKNALKALANMTPEQRSARTRRGLKTRWVNPERRREHGERFSARMTGVWAAAKRLEASQNGAAAPRELIGARLRAARAQAGFSRAKAVKGLEKFGISITVDAVKNHESDTNQPRPDVRRAYAKLYEKSQNELFGA